MNNSISTDLLKQLETLSHLDRQEVETFIGYLKSRPQKQNPKDLYNNLVEKAIMDESKFIVVSIAKTHPMFINVKSYGLWKNKLCKVAEIMVNFANITYKNNYIWNSEYYNRISYNFTNTKTSERIAIKTHFQPNSRFYLDDDDLKNEDIDVFVSVLFEETDLEYKATICGWISRVDAIDLTAYAKLNPFNRSKVNYLEMHELNYPKDLF